MRGRDRHRDRVDGINRRLRPRSYSDVTIVVHEAPAGAPGHRGPGDAFFPIGSAPVTRVPTRR